MEAPAQGVAGAQHQQQHYWGQALQYLEKSADVVPGAPSRILSPPFFTCQWSITDTRPNDCCMLMLSA